MSIEDQLLLVYSEITGLMDKGWVADTVMLHFLKIFEVLLNKLRDIGVCTVLLNRIFFCQIAKCVVVGGSFSSAGNASNFVP